MEGFDPFKGVDSFLSDGVDSLKSVDPCKNRYGPFKGGCFSRVSILIL